MSLNVNALKADISAEKSKIESQKEIKQLLRGAEEVPNEYFKDEVVYKFRGD